MLTKEMLCAYLPYDVKAVQSHNGKDKLYSLYGIKYSEYAKEWTVFIDDSRHGDYQNVYLKGIRLALRPLSSINLKWFQDNIDPDLEDFRINCEPENNHFSVEVCEKVLGWSALSYEEYQLFLKNHVDIFGLLEYGYAIELKEEDNG